MGEVNHEWISKLEHVLKLGKVVSPRGMETLEILNGQFVASMNQPVISVEDRNVSYDFMFGEAAWILGGRNDLKSMLKVAPSYAKYSDDGLTLSGAYGPKVVTQLNYVIEALRADKDSRQAVMTIWERNPMPSKDIPCTLSLQFMIRDGELHCFANMRSSDVWIGLIYDTFCFSMIAAYVAIELRHRAPWFSKLRVGKLHLNAASQHLYERNIQKAKEIVDSEEVNTLKTKRIDLDRFSRGTDLVAYLENRTFLEPHQWLGEFVN